MHISFLQLQTLNTVVKEGSFQAGAKKLNKTHPGLIKSIKNLEDALGFSLFCREGYRPELTDEGKVVYDYSQRILHLLEELKSESEALKSNAKPEITIAIGDITPDESYINTINLFLQENKAVTVHLLKENIYGPNERLLASDADLIIHHIDNSNLNIEYKELSKVNIIPVISPKLLKTNDIESLTYQDLSHFTQCVIRDTSNTNNLNNYFIIEDADNITVYDQHTKKSLITSGACWGHMPDYIVKQELIDGTLISLKNQHMKGKEFDIVCARLKKYSHKPIENTLWDLF